MTTTSNIPCNPGCQYRACTRSKLKRFERKRVQHGDIRSAARPHDTGGYTSLFWFYCRWPVCGEGRPTSMRAIYSVCAQSGYTYDKTGRVSNIIRLTLVLYIGESRDYRHDTGRHTYFACFIVIVRRLQRSSAHRGNHGTTNTTQDVIRILFVLLSL